jgi:hypothetical protein
MQQYGSPHPVLGNSRLLVLFILIFCAPVRHLSAEASGFEPDPRQMKRM